MERSYLPDHVVPTLNAVSSQPTGSPGIKYAKLEVA